MRLREMSVANWLSLAMRAPIQRLRADGFRTGRQGEADKIAWREVWQANKLDARQRIPYLQMMTHGRGLMSVWPNEANRKSPIIRPENDRRVHLDMDPEDPFTVKWAVKVFTVDVSVPSQLWTPSPVPTGRTDVAVVYDAEQWVRFEKPGTVTVESGAGPGGAWSVAAAGANPLGECPFVPFDNQADADGVPQSALSPLMPAQDALNTIRFNTLLAMQFSAFRQRIVTAYDPIVRDAAGVVQVRKDAAGNPILDPNGLQQPLLNSPGRPGVDRLLAFPGSDTKVFDLPESNLGNYTTVLGEFLSQLFAIGQIPPQYLLTRMANLSGDALAGAESTLASLVADLQLWVGESLESVMRLANKARGESEQDVASEVIWADAEARSFAQIIDAIVKLVSVNFPREAAFELIPGATPQKVERWMTMMDGEQSSSLVSMLADQFRTEPTVAAQGRNPSMMPSVP